MYQLEIKRAWDYQLDRVCIIKKNLDVQITMKVCFVSISSESIYTFLTNNNNLNPVFPPWTVFHFRKPHCQPILIEKLQLIKILSILLNKRFDFERTNKIDEK